MHRLTTEQAQGGEHILTHSIDYRPCPACARTQTVLIALYRQRARFDNRWCCPCGAIWSEPAPRRLEEE